MFQFTGFLLLSLFHCYSEIKISVTNHKTHHCLFIALHLVVPKTLVWPCNVGPPKFGLGPLIFSSPEHEVLMVSFCDRPMFVDRRPQFL